MCLSMFRFWTLIVWCVAAAALLHCSESKLTRLCDNLSFTAVAPTSDHSLLLFRGTSVWLLDLDQLQAQRHLHIRSLFSCLRNYSDDKIVKLNYFVWNPFEPKTNHLCFLANNITCANSPINGLFDPVDNYQSNQANCLENVKNNRKLIEFSGEAQSEEKFTTKIYRLNGRHFAAVQTYMPSTYDDQRIRFQSRVLLLSREVDIADEDEASSTEATADVYVSQASETVNNVDTFTTLRDGSMFVFFPDQFCIIGLEKDNTECIGRRRPTGELVGCGIPVAAVESSISEADIELTTVQSMDTSFVTNISSVPLNSSERSTTLLTTVETEIPLTTIGKFVETFNQTVEAITETPTTRAAIITTTTESVTSNWSSESLSTTTEANFLTSTERRRIQATTATSVSSSSSKEVGGATTTTTTARSAKYDIDFLKRKRNELERDLSKRDIVSTSGRKLLSYYVVIGFWACLTITNRGIEVILITILWIQVALLAILLPLYYCRCIPDLRVMGYILRTYFVRNDRNF